MRGAGGSNTLACSVDASTNMMLRSEGPFWGCALDFFCRMSNRDVFRESEYLIEFPQLMSDDMSQPKCAT